MPSEFSLQRDVHQGPATLRSLAKAPLQQIELPMIRPRFIIALFWIAFVAAFALMIAIGHNRIRITRGSYANYTALINDPSLSGAFVLRDVPPDATAIKYFGQRGIGIFELTFAIEENSFAEWADKLGDIEFQQDPEAIYLKYDNDEASGGRIVECNDCRNIQGTRVDGAQYQALFDRATGRAFFQIWYP